MSKKATQKKPAAPVAMPRKRAASKEALDQCSKSFLCLVLISSVSLVTVSVFGSWDKLGFSADINSRLWYSKQQRTRSEGLMVTAETNVDQGLQAVLEDKTLSQETKMENVRVAEKLKTIMRTAREKIL